jgi:hypothetical protein
MLTDLRCRSDLRIVLTVHILHQLHMRVHTRLSELVKPIDQIHTVSTYKFWQEIFRSHLQIRLYTAWPLSNNLTE